MILEIFKAVVLGVAEGITEFLPISSTGHLILLNRWVSFSDPFTKMFDIVIQLGAILAVVVYFWKRLWPFGKLGETKKLILVLWQKTLVAVVPALFLGALFGKIIESRLFNPAVVAGSLLIGGLLLVYIEKKPRPTHFNAVSEINFKTAFFIGLIQCVAMVPGTSRSAATIIGALLLGASRLAAVEFSFFLAIPTMVAATGYSLLKHAGSVSSPEFIILAVGFVAAFLTALAIIKFILQYIQHHNFTPFGYYRIALGIVVLIYFL